MPVRPRVGGVRRKKYPRKHAGKRQGASKYGTHGFKETFFLKSGAGSDLWMDGAAARAFVIGDVPDVAALLSKYDWYKINGVKLTFMPTVNASFNSSSDGNQQRILVPTLTTKVDYQDTLAEGADELGASPFSKRTLLSGVRTFYIKPKPKVNTTDAAGNPAALQMPSKKTMWCNSDNTDVPHLGFKWAVDLNGVQGAAISPYRIQVTYFISCKGQRASLPEGYVRPVNLAYEVPA